MAQDKNGAELKRGDRILVEATVHSLYKDDLLENLTVELLIPHAGKKTYFTIRSEQVKKAD
jgi:hypothetical protein